MHPLTKGYQCTLVLSATNSIWAENMSQVLFCWKRDLQKIKQNTTNQDGLKYLKGTSLLEYLHERRKTAIRAIFIFGSYIYIHINARIKIKIEIYVTFLVRFFQQQKGMLFLCYLYYQAHLF